MPFDTAETVNTEELSITLSADWQSEILESDPTESPGWIERAKIPLQT